LCEDKDVVGTSFFVYDYAEGDLIKDVAMADESFTAADRTAAYRSFASTLAKLHAVDVEAAGLADLSSKPHLFVGRQVSVWTKQFQASETEPMPDMDFLVEWLPEHLPADAGDVQTLFHGDFRLDNVLFTGSRGQSSSTSQEGLKVEAVLDWELCTIGHPMLDLAHACLPYYLPRMVGSPITGFTTPPEGGSLDEELKKIGIPSLAQFLADYCSALSRNACQTAVCVTRPDQSLPTNWEFYVSLALFRAAAILQGVHKRALQGNASAANAVAVGKLASVCATTGRRAAEAHEQRLSAEGTKSGGTKKVKGTKHKAIHAPPGNKLGMPSKTPTRSGPASEAMDGALGPLFDPLLSPHVSDRAREALGEVRRMVETEIIPLEKELLGDDYYLGRGTRFSGSAQGTTEGAGIGAINGASAGGARWNPVHAEIEALKEQAKSKGLFNAFLPPALSTGLAGEANPGFTVLEYAPMAEATGRCLLAPEVFNCNAPDTGNMEVFAVAGS